MSDLAATIATQIGDKMHEEWGFCLEDHLYDIAIPLISVALAQAKSEGRREGLRRAEEITRQWLSETCYGANDYDHGLEDAAKQIADAIAKEAEK